MRCNSHGIARMRRPQEYRNLKKKHAQVGESCTYMRNSVARVENRAPTAFEITLLSLKIIRVIGWPCDWFFKVESAVIEMIMFFGFPFSFGFFIFSFGFLKIRIGIVLSASAFNSCMIEFSIPDYNEKYYQKYFQTLNVVKLCSVRNGSSVSTAVNERREGTVVAVRAYLCRCTSFPFYDGLLWLHSTDDRKGDGFFLLQTITGAQVRFFFFYFYNAFPHFFSTFTIRPSIPSLFHCPTGHESRRFNVRVG